MNAGPLVVEAVRDDVVESRHLVDVAVVDASGKLVAQAGEPDTVAYLRSSAKPIQATVCLELGWAPKGEQQLAVACASHNGEAMHVEQVRAILSAAELNEEAFRLRLPPTRPSLVGAVAPPDAYGPIYHNCSGKHAAMLATMVAKGWEPDEYAIGDGRLQQAIKDRIEGLARRPARDIAGDGCGVLTFAFTLAEAATIFSRVPGECPAAMDAMRKHPRLVAGSNRICTSVMSWLPGIVVKVGAEGLMCGVLDEAGIAFALKARDGAIRGREIATLRVLENLGVLKGISTERLLGDIMPRLHPLPFALYPHLRCVGQIQRA